MKQHLFNNLNLAVVELKEKLEMKIHKSLKKQRTSSMEFLVRPIVYVEEFPNRDARVKA